MFINDNFKTFNLTEIKDFRSALGIKWKFILERSPWQGGFYERLVGLVKSCIKNVFSNQRLSFDELNTIITEVEGVSNERPLLYLNYTKNIIAKNIIWRYYREGELFFLSQFTIYLGEFFFLYMNTFLMV